MRSLKISGIVLCLAAVPFAARADEQSAARECAKVSNEPARLACYDVLFRLGSPDEKLPKRIRAKIAAANALPGGLYRLEFDNGQVWVTKEAMWDVSFAAGQDVFVDRGVLNSYRISPVDRARFLTAKRIK
jgi:hypothetical protein